MSINTDPGSVNSGGAYLSLPTAPTTSTLPLPSLDITSASDSSIAASEEPPAVVDFIASVPLLNLNSGSNLYSKLSTIMSANTMAELGASLAQSYNETMNYILDSWSKSIQQQDEANRQAAIRNSIKEDYLNSQIIQQDIINQNIVDQEIKSNVIEDSRKAQNGDLTTYWNNASPAERTQFNETYGQEATNAYYANLNNPVEQNFDAMKLMPIITPLFTTEALVINPLALDISMRSIGGDEEALVPDLLGMLPGSLQLIPQVNLMVPIPLLTSAVSASLSLFAKNKANPNANNDIDEQYVQELAKKVLSRTQNISDSIASKHPNYLALDSSQRQSLDISASLFALTTVLLLDVKSQAKFSNLSPEEFASMLKEGITGNDLLNQVVLQIQAILSKIPDKNQVAEYVNFLLNYINRSSAATVSTLKSFANVLMYATQEIGNDVRAVSTPE